MARVAKPKLVILGGIGEGSEPCVCVWSVWMG